MYYNEIKSYGRFFYYKQTLCKRYQSSFKSIFVQNRFSNAIETSSSVDLSIHLGFSPSLYLCYFHQVWSVIRIKSIFSTLRSFHIFGRLWKIDRWKTCLRSTENVYDGHWKTTLSSSLILIGHYTINIV